MIPGPNRSSITLSSADGLQQAHCPARGSWERGAESKPSLGRRHEAKAWERRMNRDGIKIAWKIDRKAASARSVTKENPSRGKDRVASCKAAGIPTTLSFYGRAILSYALRASHIVTGCFGTVFAPALTQCSVMPELPKGLPKPGFDRTRFSRTAWLTSCFA